MQSEPTIMRCLGQAAGEIIRAVKTPVNAPIAPPGADSAARVVSQCSAEACVGGLILRRTVTDEIVTANAAPASNPSPCA